MSEQHQLGNPPTTGHVWDDDLADYTNQPPKWWMLGLTVSTLWVLVYFIYYPSIPLSTSGGFTKGIGGWTAISEMEADQSKVDAVRGRFEQRLVGMTPAAILADRELTEYVKRSGKVLFGDNCGACHGTNGIGTQDREGLFAPILNDDDWLFGGRVDNIHESIVGGRRGVMPAYKSIASEAEIAAMAEAVARGKIASLPLFAEKGCIGCHGVDARGMHALGSANLVDSVWRFDSSLEGIKRTIAYGVNSGDPMTRQAIMPSFKEAGKLSDAEMKKLAVYVYKFGGGQADAVAASK